jgi:hypothetical protein
VVGIGIVVVLCEELAGGGATQETSRSVMRMVAPRVTGRIGLDGVGVF